MNTTQLIATATLPTKFGNFTVAGFKEDNGKEHIALIKGEISEKKLVPTRIHSECLTGDAFGSLRCDCQAQLEKSLKLIASKPFGVVLYLRQEGRGIGILNKIRAYNLQDQGYDTVDANLMLGLPADARTYEMAGAMLQALNITSVLLLTNNPEKVQGLERSGISVRRQEHITDPTSFNQDYLNTKRERMNHILPSYA